MSEEVRNWAELLPEVLLLIFQKLGAIGILFAAQNVCSSWKRLSFEPLLWRCIDMRIHWDSFDKEHALEEMAKVAIDRSQGQLIEFSVEYCATDELLQYISESTSILRCLRLISCCSVSDFAMIEMAKKFPQLEELDISYSAFSKDVLENVGKLCPKLKSLQLNHRAYRFSLMLCDEEALTIAKNMPELRHLQFCGNKLTDYGLRAILDGCIHLQSLDIRQCFSVNLDDGLHQRCIRQIKNLKLPNEYTDVYCFGSDFGGYMSFDEYPYGSSDLEIYPYGFSDLEISDDEYYDYSPY